MSLYTALAEHRNKWVAVNTVACCFHGILQEVKPDYIKLYSYRSDGKRNTEYLRMDQIIRFCPDAPELFESQMEVAYSLGNDDDGKAERVLA